MNLQGGRGVRRKAGGGGRFPLCGQGEGRKRMDLELSEGGEMISNSGHRTETGLRVLQWCSHTRANLTAHCVSGG